MDFLAQFTHFNAALSPPFEAAAFHSFALGEKQQELRLDQLRAEGSGRSRGTLSRWRSGSKHSTSAALDLAGGNADSGGGGGAGQSQSHSDLAAALFGSPQPATPVATWVQDIFRGTLTSEMRCLLCETVKSYDEVRRRCSNCTRNPAPHMT